MKASATLTDSIYNECADVFFSMRCFKGTFSLQVNDDMKPNQAPQGCVACALEEHFEKSLTVNGWIIVPLGVNDTTEKYNRFVLGHKPNGAG